MNAKSWRQASRYFFVAPALLYLVIFMFYPLVYTVNLSFFGVTAGNFLNGTAQFVGLENYDTFVRSPDFAFSLFVTIVFTIGSLVFQHSIGFAFALFFNKRFPLSTWLRSVMMVVWVLPTVVAASLWRWMYAGSYGVFNAVLQAIGIPSTRAWLTEPSVALIAVIGANIWVGIPFHMMLLYAGLQNIPGELKEAALVDGASALQRFRSITLPLMKPVSLVTLLLGFIHTFKVFDLIYVMTAGGPANATNVLSIAVYRLSFEYFRLGVGAAAANILLIIPLAFALVYLWVTRKTEVTA